MSDNVVLFPNKKKDSPPHSMEQVYKKALESRKEHIEYVIDEVVGNIIGFSREEGFDLGSEDCLKSTSMMIETLRAGYYKSAGITHPLHAVAEMMFETIDSLNNVSVEFIPNRVDSANTEVEST